MQIAQAIGRILEEALGVDPETVDDTFAMGTPDLWDSATHINIMLILERDFGVAIDEDTIVKATSYAGLADIVGGAAA